MTEKTDLVPVSSTKPIRRHFSLLPTTFSEAQEMAKLIAGSEFAPKDYKGKWESVLIAVQMGADLGLKPMQALQNIAVINGRPSVWGDAALAIVMPKAERFLETIDGDGDKRTATCLLKRKGWPDEIVRHFSVLDAKKANLWGKAGPWQTYPDRMLQMRARGFALRDGGADLLMGLVLAEEALDYPDAIPGEVVSVEAVVNLFEGVDADLVTSIDKGFGVVGLTPGLRTAKVTEYLGGATPETRGAQAAKLLEWLKDEYSRQKTGKSIDRSAKKTDTNNKPPAPAASEPAMSAGREGTAETRVVPSQGDSGQPQVHTPWKKGDPLTAGEIPFAKPSVAVDPKLSF